MSRYFDNVDDIINCNASTDWDNLAVFTVMAWIKPVSRGEATTGGYVFSKNNATKLCRIGSSNDANEMSIFVDYSGATDMFRNTGTATTYGIWQHATWQWLGGPTAATDTRMWINANLITTTSGSNNGAGSPVTDAGGNVEIGNRGSDTARTFHGEIAHVLLYNVVLTHGEIIQSMWFPGSVTRGLVGYWPLAGTSSPEPELSGRVKNGVVTGALLGNNPPATRSNRTNRRFIPYQSIPTTTLLFVNQSLSMTLSESQAFDFLKVISQSITFTEAQYKNILKAFSESYTLSESKSIDFLKTVSDSLTLTESQSKNLLKGITQALSLSESQGKNLLKVVSQNLSITESQALNLVGIVLPLINFLSRGNIETHDKISMLRDLSFTSISSADIDEMERDSDKITWDFHVN